MDETITRHDAPLANADPMAELRKVRDTAEKMANGDYQEEADLVRVLAGLIHQLAQEVEALAEPDRAPLDREAPEELPPLAGSGELERPV